MEHYLDKRNWEQVSHDFMNNPGPICLMFSDLRPIFSHYEEKDKEETYKYIIAYYNPKSPVRFEPDLIARKKAAAQVAGWKAKEFGRYPSHVDDILMAKNEAVNQLIIDYCYLVGGVDFTILAVYEQGMYNELINLIGRAFTKDTVKKIKEITDEINEIKEKILANDTFSKELSKALYAKTESIRIELRPEDIARKIKDGEEPVKVKPYGNDYDFPLFGDMSKLREVK